SGLAAALRALGAAVVELPAIRIVPRIDTEEVGAAVADLHSYALVCLTSPNGVRLLFEAMGEQGRDAPALAAATVAAIGPGGAARTRSDRRRGRRAGGGGVARRGARRGPDRGQAGARSPGRRGPRHPPGGAS